MRRVQKLTRSSVWLLLSLLATAWNPGLAHAQAIDRGREPDVLRLLLPYVDEGPVGEGGKLGRIAIGQQAIELDVVNGTGQTGSLRLTPRAPADQADGSKSFRIAVPVAPTPQLAQAQQLLRAAIVRNDDGSFFAHARVIWMTEQTPVMDSGALRFALQWASALWGILLALLVWHAWRDRAPLKWLFWLSFALLAALVRRQTPFVPLHANGHGLEELLVAIGGPDDAGATGRFVLQYGPAWLTPLRSLTAWIGQTHDQLAVVSSALGGLAAAFGTAAAWRLSRQWLWTAMAAGIFIFVPVAARVGHSESPFVVAQLLVALSLWLSTHRTHGTQFALLLTLALLALGHPVGIGFAAGVYLLILAISLDDAEWRPAFHLLLLAGTVIAVGVELSQCRMSVADRLTSSPQFQIPVPTRPQDYWLWLQAGYAPRAAMLAMAMGLWSFGRGRVGRMRWVVLGTALMGTGLVAAAGLMVTACVTDGLRYQAPFAPVLTLLVARAGQGFAEHFQGRILAAALWLSIAWGFGDLDAGRRPDAQGQAYLDLRQNLRRLTGDVWLVTPDRARGHEQVVVQMPLGRLSTDGAILRTLTVSDVQTACTTHMTLPKQAFVWLDPACAAVVPTGATPACETLLPLVGETVQEFHVSPVLPLSTAGMAGEFNKYPPGAIALKLARLRCP